MRWLEKHKTRETDCIDLAMPVVKPIKIFDKTAKNEQAGDRSQLEAPSLNNSFGFRVSFGNCLQAKAVHQVSLNCSSYILDGVSLILMINWTEMYRTNI